MPSKRRQVEGSVCVIITVTGTDHSIAEIGEILAWVHAALSLSKFPSRVCLSDPVLKPKPISRHSLPGTNIVADCKIFSTLGAEENHNLDPGNCWADILGNTVYVKGYPTARRAEHNTGMEVSLSTMISLANSRRLNRFKGVLCIKGYCSIILPTRWQGNFIYWHLVTNRNGEHMSYTDDKVRRLWNYYPQDLSISALEKSRHILGWCENIQNIAGMYDLKFTQVLPFFTPIP